MSKLIDSLRRISRSTSSPIGFRPASIPHPAPMLLLAHLPRASGDTLELIDKSGLDGLIVGTGKQGVDAQALARLSQAAGSIPWGIFWAASLVFGGAPLVEAGADFVVAEVATASAAILQETRLGRILSIEPSLSDNMVRAIDALAAEAVLLHAGFEEASHLTINHLLLCQRVAGLLHKPLLVTISPALGATDLQALVGVGIKGAVVRLHDKEAAARLTELKHILKTLTAPTREGVEAVLPSLSSELPQPEEDTDLA